MTDLSSRFHTRVRSAYADLRGGSLYESEELSKGLTAAAEIRSGHPLASSLEIGQKQSLTIASVFLDIGEFTRRTLIDDLTYTSDIAHAVLSGFTEIVDSLGGHVLGLRGDGLFAGFGPVKNAELACLVALASAAAALDRVQNDVNPWLRTLGQETVTASAGVDFGPAMFIRSGIGNSSEVNVVGFHTNFAAKCEKYAGAWEIVAGQECASHVYERNLLHRHEKSPKEYASRGVGYSYGFYRYQWRHLIPAIDGIASDLGGLNLTEFDNNYGGV